MMLLLIPFVSISYPLFFAESLPSSMLEGQPRCQLGVETAAETWGQGTTALLWARHSDQALFRSTMIYMILHDLLHTILIYCVKLHVKQQHSILPRLQSMHIPERSFAREKQVPHHSHATAEFLIVSGALLAQGLRWSVLSRRFFVLEPLRCWPPRGTSLWV